MANFEYKALKTDGTMMTGTLDAGNRQEAIRRLESRGLEPVRLQEQGAAGASKTPVAAKAHGKKVPHAALENFTRQLSSLLAAGVTLARSLQILGRETGSSAARDKWKEIHDLVIDGTSLADAMARSPEVFPKIYTAMVQAGEMGGFLEVVLGQIADFQIRERDLKSRVTSAMTYPAVLMFLAVAVLIFLLTYFIPKFQTLFSSFGHALPLITQLIVGASNILLHYGFFVAAFGGAAGYGFYRWLQSEAGRRSWQKLILKLPVVGPLTARFALTRFCRMLGTLIGAGVPLINALRVAKESIGNQTLIDTVSNSIDRVQQGESLANSLADCKVLFPGSVVEMISVGEESGHMDKELVRLADVIDNELNRQLQTAVSLAEPLLLFVMAAIIGTIFVGMVIPIYTMQDYIK